ncbi:MAG: hypothetical protein J0M29_09050 [Chitinophagales bacterium]|nr:hypothetical protein [Chitinophagales bacterium]
MLRLLCSLLLLSAFLQTGGAQIVNQESYGFVYNRETTFNFRLATNRSFGIGMEWGKLRTYNKTKTLSISLSEMKHPKEQKQNAAPSLRRSSRPFVYAKRNSLFVLRSGWGKKRYFSEKAKQKGVAVGISYSVGPALGLLKPYYLILNLKGDPSSGVGRTVLAKYSESNHDSFLDNTLILGAAPFTKGLSEMSVLPGGTGQIAYHMDWGAYDEMVKALEIGLSVDVFAKKAPIFVGDEQNRQVFFNFFLNLQFGKRK